MKSSVLDPKPPDTGVLAWLYADILDWCRGRLWLPRALLLGYFAYMGFNQFRDWHNWNLFQGINLPIHEMGHVLFRPLGEFLYVCGGTILQLAAPVIAMGMFFKQRDYFGISIAFVWLSTNMLDVGVYMADANEMVLPLVNIGGGEAEHDWQYIFRHLGLLPHAETIGALMRAGAHCVMLLAIAAGVWMIIEMVLRRAERDTKEAKLR